MTKRKGGGKIPHLPRTTSITPDLSHKSNQQRGMERAMMRDAIRQYARSQKMTLAQVREERKQLSLKAKKAEP